MAITKDAANVLTFSSAASNGAPLTITTLLANDIIIVMAGAQKSGATGLHVTGVTDTHGLVWSFRSAGSSVFHQPTVGDIEFWYALAPIAQAYAITVTFSQAIDDAVLAVVAVNGLNLTTPWSAAAAVINNQVSNATATAPNVAAYNPSEQHLFVLAAWFSGDNSPTGTPGAGFTHLIGGVNAGGTFFGVLDSEFEIVSGGRSGAVAFGNPTTNSWQILVDGLTSDSGGGGGAGKSTRQGFKFWW